MRIKLKLHSEGNLLFLESQDIYKFIGETTPRELELAMYIEKLVELLNYPLTHNTEMSIPDEEYTFLNGWLNGFECAKHIETRYDGSLRTIKWGRYNIEVETLPIQQRGAI